MSVALSFGLMAASAMIPALNTMLGGGNRGAYESARSALADADSVQDALEAVGILDELDDDVAVEARALLDALPASLDESIIAALESAFERDVPALIEWVEGDSLAVMISEEPHGDGVRVRIAFVSPDGSTFLD
jgi:hypothetical protein